jgi:hypothetical protein
MKNKTFIPEYRNCKNDKCTGAGVLQKEVHHFLNTKEPYMIRICNRCGIVSLVVPPAKNIIELF